VAFTQLSVNDIASTGNEPKEKTISLKPTAYIRFSDVKDT
jgi:hypothetical protein